MIATLRIAFALAFLGCSLVSAKAASFTLCEAYGQRAGPHFGEWGFEKYPNGFASYFSGGQFDGDGHAEMHLISCGERRVLTVPILSSVGGVQTLDVRYTVLSELAYVMRSDEAYTLTDLEGRFGVVSAGTHLETWTEQPCICALAHPSKGRPVPFDLEEAEKWRS